MPELPDVEVLRTYLESASLHQEIGKVSVESAGILWDRRVVKCWLMDQSLMAGAGNVYSDETLFQPDGMPRSFLVPRRAAEGICPR